MRLAIGYRQMAALAEADSAIDRAITIFRQAGLTQSLLYASALGWKASALVGLGRRSEARQVFAESIALDEALGDNERAAVERLNLAELEFADGDVAAALAYTEATLEALRWRHPSALIVAYLNVAAYRIVLEDYASAEDAARQALRLVRRVGYRLWKAVAVQHFATLAALRGDSQRAAHLLGYTEACYAAEGSAREPTELSTLVILERALHDRLAADERAGLERSGRTLTDDEAIELALSRGTD